MNHVAQATSNTTDDVTWKASVVASREATWDAIRNANSDGTVSTTNGSKAIALSIAGNTGDARREFTSSL